VNIDERLQAFTMNLELQFRETEALRGRMDALTTRMDVLTSNVDRVVGVVETLAGVVASHERRIERLES
jgi:hypothetical protein